MGDVVIGSFDFLSSFFMALPNFVAAMVVSFVCGLIIGLERESRGKPAGARTLVLICLGSALFVQISKMIAGGFGDPGRVAAQIVSGIGFLGAGAIMQRSDQGYISGLTTAASIWVTAAVGMICGAERYIFALLSTGVVVGSLRVLRHIERILFYERHIEKRRIVFRPQGGKTEWQIVDLIEEHMIQGEEYSFKSIDAQNSELLFQFCRTNRNHRNFLTDLAKLEPVTEMQRI